MYMYTYNYNTDMCNGVLSFCIEFQRKCCTQAEQETRLLATVYKQCHHLLTGSVYYWSGLSYMVRTLAVTYMLRVQIFEMGMSLIELHTCSVL